MKRIISAAIALLTAGAALLSIQSCNQGEELTLQVKTQHGIVEGIEMDGGVKAFLGVPFAEAPVGDLRWAIPQPKEDWEGVLETKAFGPDPMQPTMYSDMVFRGAGCSEDCLYLNIWTCAERANDALPVLIYFNGGGLMAGSGSEPRYDGAAIAREGVVGVTANYREGIFGFFAHPDLTAGSAYHGSGNYGFYDQVAAIDWVKANIAAFGGDPERITIVGESAGSFSVSLLMVSPLSKGSIAGAMLSSGAEVKPYYAMSQTDAEAAGAARLASVGIGSLAEARAMDADALQALLPPAGMSNVVIDGLFMTEAPDAIYERGEQAQVPLLAGWNSLEGTPGQQLRGQEPTLENLKKGFERQFGDMTDEILTAYGIVSDEDVMSQKCFDLCSDLFTGFPTWKVCDYQASKTSQPVYRYKYNHGRPSNDMGAVHSADIEYAMGNLATNEAYEWLPEDYAISELFLSYYANFCKNGNPNGPGLPAWTPINGKLDAAPVMQIDVVSGEVASAEKENAYRTLEKFYDRQR